MSHIVHNLLEKKHEIQTHTGVLSVALLNLILRALDVLMEHGLDG